MREGGGNPLTPGQGSALVRLLDWRGNALCAGTNDAVCFLPLSQHGGSSSSSPAQCSSVWVLSAAAPCRYSLQNAGSGRFLTASGGQITCGSAPDSSLQLFMDLDRRLVLRLPAGKACLQASPSSTAAVVGQLPLGQQQARASKLFRVEEVGLPLHSLQAWPFRAALRCEQSGGAYLSASGRAVTATSPVACCSEEFLLALGQAAQLSVHSGTLVAPSSSLWTGDGRQLVSYDPGTGQVVLAGQRAVTGGEQFTLRLSSTSELCLLAERQPPAAQQQAQQPQQAQQRAAAAATTPRADANATSAEGSSAMLAPVAVKSGTLVAAADRRGSGSRASSSSGGSGGGSGGFPSKPTKFGLELASNKPLLLQTAHGQLLGCQSPFRSVRPQGMLLKVPAASLASPGSPASAPADAVAAAAAERFTWLLTHHGDCVYSLRHARSGHNLYIDADSGSPCLDHSGHVVYPDSRLLFWIEPGWSTLATPDSGSIADSGSASGSPHASSTATATSVGSGTADAAAPAAAEAAGSGVEGFVEPTHPGSSLTVSGFSLRSVQRVGGRHLYLSVLPDGLLTTVYALDSPTRWELFTPIDFQTLLRSPLQLFEQLPSIVQPAASEQPAGAQQQGLRRSASMQALSSSSSWGSLAAAAGGGAGAGAGVGAGAGGGMAASTGLLGSRRPSRGSFPRIPSMPAVQEHEFDSADSIACSEEEGEDADGEPGSPACHVALAGTPAQQQQQQQQQAGQPAAPLVGRPPRRTQSESALADLQQRQRQQQGRHAQRPLWLAQLLRQPRQPEGWGVCSPAPLHDIACRQLCVALVQHYQQQHGSSRLPLGLLQAVEAELSTHLPDEVAGAIGQELRLLTQPPAPTKLSLQELGKAAAAGKAEEGEGSGGGRGEAVPSWARPFLRNRPPDEVLGWQPVEAYLCSCCQGTSGVLLPLDPYCNPGHHLFLTAMERRARGGGRVRLRARRRLDQEDLLVVAMKTGKMVLLTWALGRCLGALLFGGGGSSSGARRGITAAGASSSGGSSGARRRMLGTPRP